MDSYNSQPELGELIRFLRKQKGLTQNDLAQELLLDQSCISRWEKGIMPVDVDTIAKLSSIFHIPMQDFCTPGLTLTKLRNQLFLDEKESTPDISSEAPETLTDMIDTPSIKETDTAEATRYQMSHSNKSNRFIIGLSVIIVILSSILIIQNTVYFPPSHPSMESRYIYDEFHHQEVLEMAYVYRGILTNKKFYDIKKDLTIVWYCTSLEKKGITILKISFYNNTKKAKQWTEPNKVLYIYDTNKQ